MAGHSSSLVAPVVSRASFPAWQPLGSGDNIAYELCPGDYETLLVTGNRARKSVSPKTSFCGLALERRNSRWRRGPGSWDSPFPGIAYPCCNGLPPHQSSPRILLLVPCRDRAGVPHGGSHMELEGLCFRGWLPTQLLPSPRPFLTTSARTMCTSPLILGVSTKSKKLSLLSQSAGTHSLHYPSFHVRISLFLSFFF